MKFLLTSLPTKGVTIKNPSVTYIDINPLKYKQLKDFTNRTYVTDIDKTIAEIECFIQDIDNWRDLSAYDLSSIIFTREYISATYKEEIIVTSGGVDYKVPIADITFKDLNEELLKIKSIELQDRVFPFKIPTILEYYQTLITVSSELKSDDFWLNKYDCMILAAIGLNPSNFDEYLKIYAEAAGDDIVTIKYIDRLLNNQVNDVTVKGQGGDDRVISIQKLISDIFRLIQNNRLLNTSKVKFKSKI